MKAVLLSTEGAYLEAVIDINGKRYCVMDEVSSDDGRPPAVGKLFNVELYSLLDEDESWESMFQSNPEKKMCLEQVKGWEYKAYGKIISVNPVQVDCGLLIEEDVLHTNDPTVIGEYIGFTISRLCAHSTDL